MVAHVSLDCEASSRATGINNDRARHIKPFVSLVAIAIVTIIKSVFDSKAFVG
jgi:hypothetical protein